MKFFILFFLFFLITFTNTQTSSPTPIPGTPTPPNCIYKNGIQSYDIDKLSNKSVNGYFSVEFTANRLNETFDIIFNFCNRSVKSGCYASRDILACQSRISDRAYYVTGEFEMMELVKFHDGGSGMTITYRVFETTYCKPYDYRLTELILNCNPDVEYKVISNNNESIICDYAITIETKYVCSICAKDCGKYGQCNPRTAKCDCISQMSGDDCSKSAIYINGVNSTTTEGGLAIIYGYFGNISNSDSSNIIVSIGDQNCQLHSVFSNQLSCFIGPGSGVKDVKVVSFGISTLSKNSFSFLEIIKSCPSNCTSKSNGNCDTKSGVCNCIGDYYGIDCGQKKSVKPPDVSVNDTTGEIGLGYEDINYNINIISLVEIDINGVVINDYPLNNNWTIKTNSTNSESRDNNNSASSSNNNSSSNNSDNNSSSNSSSSNNTISNNLLYSLSSSSSNNNNINKINHFIQNIKSKNNENSNFTVEYIVEEINEKKKQYTFADIDFELEQGSIKISISIKNYIYSNILNTLQLRIQSSLNETSVNNRDCNNKDIKINNSINNSQLLNYISIVKDHRVFNARFINKLISDSRVSFMGTTLLNQDNSSILIALNLPHCVEECLIDPDFSLLVTPEFQENCNGREKWFLPVVIAVPCVFVVLAFVIGALLYRRHRTTVLIIKKKINLKALSKKNKDQLYMNDNTIG